MFPEFGSGDCGLHSMMTVTLAVFTSLSCPFIEAVIFLTFFFFFFLEMLYLFPEYLRLEYIYFRSTHFMTLAQVNKLQHFGQS